MLFGYHGAVRASEYRRGRRAVVLAGIAMGMVLALGLLYWKDFVARYHVIRLRADPARLRAAILEPEGSAPQLAVSLFLRTEEGKDRLAREYFDACVSSWFPWTCAGWEKGMVIFPVEGVLCVGEVEGQGSSGPGKLCYTTRGIKFISLRRALLGSPPGQILPARETPRISGYIPRTRRGWVSYGLGHGSLGQFGP